MRKNGKKSQATFGEHSPREQGFQTDSDAIRHSSATF